MTSGGYYVATHILTVWKHLAGLRECHGFTNPCGLVLRVTAGVGTGCEFATLTQPVPATWV